MTKIIPALTARTRFGEVIRRARERGERFIVDKRGEPQVVILSIEDYLQNVVKRPESLTQLQRIAKRRGLDTMTVTDIDREVRRIRKELSRGKRTP
ncbi:MAG: type II toxin-antitoxin system Phd/YefM family antitoxin [Acidobacteria bacterium]|nr:type II toxin-antitoxin system Phd/YefM family antitoxin [Acidobacteriota bacterium]